MHYNVPYPVKENANPNPTDPLYQDESTRIGSFFNCAPDSGLVFAPLTPGLHKPITIEHFLNKKLRWMTLGGQYDWTKKVYPNESPPAFPEDVGHLVRSLFPDMTPEAAIVNVYSPGDTLSLHRDVSEESTQGLVSISIGCDGLFVAGLEGETEGDLSKCLVIRLRSGDAVYMSGVARYAWHGVPQIIPDTCPTWLESWPASAAASSKQPDTAGQDVRIDPSYTSYEAWRGWMSTKRINLNVRQMQD